MNDEPAGRFVEGRYGRNSVIAAVVVTFGWHLGFDLPGLAAGAGTYLYPVLPVIAWFTYTAIGLGRARALLRHRPGGPGAATPETGTPGSATPGSGTVTSGPALAWIQAVLALAVTAVVVAACPPSSVIAPANWGWGSAGWLAVLVLWARPARELVTFQALNALVMLAGMLAKGVSDRVSLASYLTVIASSVALQLGLSLGVKALARMVDQVGARSRELTGAEAARAAAQAVHTARVERSRAVHQDTIRLLAELAAGADPTRPAIRHRGSIAAARMRRLLAETADSEEPLLDELRACADIADRNGIVVELESHGRVPELSAQVRRALAEAPIAALTSAASYARVTVSGLEDEVIVSVVCDAPAIELPISSGVTITRYKGGSEQWIDSRWPSR